MKIRILISILAALLISVPGKCEVPASFVYDSCNGDTLHLDFYAAQSSAPAPVLIYAFGGGFKGGTRRSDSYNRMFDFMTRNGVAVVSIDYRTLLKDADPASMASAEGFKSALVEAIGAATADMLKATAFVYSKAGEWNIDPNLMFACGSSAGAITALQTEYELCNDSTLAESYNLPAGFNYAGVISMAGAICCEYEPAWKKAPSPILLFQGDADAVVPFEKAVLGNFGLWGSKTISDGLSRQGTPHRFHRFNGASHEIAEQPMQTNTGEIYDFIAAVASSRCNDIINTTGYNPQQSEYKTDFSIIDYIKANM